MKILTLLLVLFTQLSLAQTAKPIVLGQSFELQSIQLSEKRKLNVYLPPSYDHTDTSTHYPVIYLLDGGLDEDFIHVVGVVQFNSFSWVNRLPESIVVGIANTDRERDMTYPTSINSEKKRHPTTGGSARFISFIEKEVQPYVNQHFRTNTSRTLIGESLAGLLATEILFTHPSLFNKYIIISPSLWWDGGSLLTKPVTTQPTTLTTVYIAVGKEGLTPSDPPRVMEVDANLLMDKIQQLKNKNITAYFDYLPGESHATIAHQATLNAIKRLYEH